VAKVTFLGSKGLTETVELEELLPISIVTPSYRSSQWLRLCIASVADQEGVEVEHIVQDSCSDDGTGQWLPSDPRVKAFIEKDSGMYDAINRGFAHSTGQILGYLNCDEQYLPGALKAVHDYFAEHPHVDVVFSDTVVADSRGDYICSRYALVPRKNQVWVRFPILTCGLFVRRHVVKELGIIFDPKWRALGDFFWVLEMVRRGLRIEVLPLFTSLFTDTGDNLCLRPEALRERHLKWQMAPRAAKLLKYFFVILYRIRLAARGSLFASPFRYAMYTLENAGERVTRQVLKPTSFWKGRSRQWSPDPGVPGGVAQAGHPPPP
jgi:glycosyltransferase involved in cell wall biosynthesis